MKSPRLTDMRCPLRDSLATCNRERAAGAAGTGARATHTGECVRWRRIGISTHVQADFLVTTGGVGAGRQAAVRCAAFSLIRLPALKSTILRLQGTGTQSRELEQLPWHGRAASCHT